MILLDTHAAIWFATDSSLLGKNSRDLADEALDNERLVISAISFWEIALLVAKRHWCWEGPPRNCDFNCSMPA